MIVQNETVVSLSYELRAGSASAEVIDAASTAEPLVFLYGAGNLLPKFEDNIAGMKVGDRFSFNLTALDGYGEVVPEMIVDLPRNIFTRDGKEIDGLLVIGNVVPMQDSHGNMLQGVIRDIGLESVKIDFNHPLAGQELHFSGEIVGIRQANAEEMAHGHAHGPDGHHHH